MHMDLCSSHRKAYGQRQERMTLRIWHIIVGKTCVKTIFLQSYTRRRATEEGGKMRAGKPQSVLLKSLPLKGSDLHVQIHPPREAEQEGPQGVGRPEARRMGLLSRDAQGGKQKDLQSQETALCPARSRQGACSWARFSRHSACAESACAILAPWESGFERFATAPFAVSVDAASANMLYCLRKSTLAAETTLRGGIR